MITLRCQTPPDSHRCQAHCYYDDAWVGGKFQAETQLSMSEEIKQVAVELTKYGRPPALSGLSLDDLEDFVKKLGLPKFRAKQIHSWIYSKWASNFEEMTDLSADLRKKLSESAEVGLLNLAHLQVSSDETRKYLFQLPDGKMVESVLMAFQARPSLTACVSS